MGDDGSTYRLDDGTDCYVPFEVEKRIRDDATGAPHFLCNATHVQRLNIEFIGDREVAAIGAIDEVFKALIPDDPEAVRRVLAYYADRFTPSDDAPLLPSGHTHECKARMTSGLSCLDRRCSCACHGAPSSYTMEWCRCTHYCGSHEAFTGPCLKDDCRCPGFMGVPQ